MLTSVNNCAILYTSEEFSEVTARKGRKEPEMANEIITTNNEDVEKFDIIEELAKLGTLVDVDGVLVDIVTYAKTVEIE